MPVKHSEKENIGLVKISDTHPLFLKQLPSSINPFLFLRKSGPFPFWVIFENSTPFYNGGSTYVNCNSLLCIIADQL